MTLDAGDLRIFEAVARCGAMNRAAAELNTVQSNVTARIRQLEERLGAPLFRRHARGVTLTPAGERLLPYAAQVGRLLSDAARAVADDGGPKGPLRIGSLETTAALRLTPLLAAYAKAHPAVDVSLTTGTTCELIEAVAAHTLEGAFVCGPVDHTDLPQELIFREELALLTAPTVVSPEDLAQHGEVRIVVLRAGCSYRQRLEALLAKRGIAAPRVLEFGTLEAIVNCVGAGLGVTLLPRSLIGRVWQERIVAVHPLPAAEARVETAFIRRKDGFVSSALDAFLAMARDAFTAQQAPVAEAAAE